ncbi:transglycosylase family protein [Yimella sp. RIT 621]|uniref:transglycosylase family protein n=1 Tax=Yimella sp. RIT 621 TaxID=2510323 RepID=UPI00197AC4CD|nr:transglycosylase family protein [Yimella sp. RIT 621]
MKDTTKRTLSWRRAAIGGTVGLALLGVAAAVAPAQAATVPDVLAKIRYCESGNNYQAQNSSSSASGAYQFLTSTWQSLSASAGYATAKSAPASVQDAAAIELYNAQGTAPWAHPPRLPLATPTGRTAHRHAAVHARLRSPPRR